MSIKSGNFSIFAEVELDTSKIQSQLNKASKGTKINIDHSSVTKAGDALEELGVKSKSAAEAGELVELNFQEANMVLSKSIDIITSMVDQVFALDDAITE